MATSTDTAIIDTLVSQLRAIGINIVETPGSDVYAPILAVLPIGKDADDYEDWDAVVLASVWCERVDFMLARHPNLPSMVRNVTNMLSRLASKRVEQSHR